MAVLGTAIKHVGSACKGCALSDLPGQGIVLAPPSPASAFGGGLRTSQLTVEHGNHLPCPIACNNSYNTQSVLVVCTHRRQGEGLALFGKSFNYPPARPNSRIDFAFDKAAFYFKFLPFTIPYPVPFRLLGDETKVRGIHHCA